MTLTIDVENADVLTLLRDMERLQLLRVATRDAAVSPVPARPAMTGTEDVLSFRTGFLAGQVSVPPDFDTMGQAEIAALFGENR
jgi:hypothetical protein